MSRKLRHRRRRSSYRKVTRLQTIYRRTQPSQSGIIGALPVRRLHRRRRAAGHVQQSLEERGSMDWRSGLRERAPSHPARRRVQALRRESLVRQDAPRHPRQGRSNDFKNISRAFVERYEINDDRRIDTWR